jgi:hypothetical protein
MSKHRVMLPLVIKRGETGLFYISSAVVPGLLVAEPTLAKALAEVQVAIDELADAASIANAEERP